MLGLGRLAMVLDEFRWHDRFEVFPLHLGEATPIDLVLVVRFGRFLGQHLATLLCPGGTALALFLVSPVSKLGLDPKQSVAQIEGCRQHDDPDQNQADWTESNKKLVHQDDDERANHRTFSSTDAAKHQHAQTEQNRVEVEYRKCDAPEIGGGKTGDKTQRDRV